MKALSLTIVIAASVSAYAAQKTVVVATIGGPTGIGGFNYTVINPPCISGNGTVGFTGSFSDGTITDQGVSANGSVIWRNSSSVSPVLTGAETQMGLSNSLNFIYSPAADGNDAAYVAPAGIVLKETDAAPGFPMLFNSFNSRPTMAADGRAYWVGGVANTSGGSTAFRILYRRDTDGTIVPMLTAGGAGDMIDGFPMTASGILFDFDVSDDGSYWTNVVTLSGPATTADGRVLKNNAVLAREGDIAIGTEKWSFFRLPVANNLGTVVFGGDTDGAAATDDFVAVNGAIAVKGDMTLDGIPLANEASPTATVNNNDLVAHLWNSSATARKLFLGSAAHLDASRLIVKAGDAIDTDGDYVADAILNEIQGSSSVSQFIQITDEGTIVVKAMWTPISGGAAVTGILKMPLPLGGDIDRDGEVGPGDFGRLSAAFGSVPGDSNWDAHADIDFDGEVGPADFGILSANFGQSDN